MSFARQIETRRHRDSAEPAEPTPFDANAALARARAAQGPARPWAGGFYVSAENFGVPIKTLNEIVAASSTLAEAEGKLAQRLASGAGHDGLRKPAQADLAARISAAHAKAHPPRRATNAR